MYKHILVPTDGSKLSRKAIDHAARLAKALDARVTAFYASPDYPMPVYADGMAYQPVSKKEYAELASREAVASAGICWTPKLLDAVESKLRKAGVECASVHAIAAAPWRAILDAAKKHKADAIVMASHGRRGVSALLLGSETQKVLTHSKLPVVVVR